MINADRKSECESQTLAGQERICGLEFWNKGGTHPTMSSLSVFPAHVLKEKHTPSTPPPTKRRVCLSFKFSMHITRSLLTCFKIEVPYLSFCPLSLLWGCWRYVYSIKSKNALLRPETWVGFWFCYLTTVWPLQAGSAPELIPLICKIRVKNRCILRLLELVILCAKHPAYCPNTGASNNWGLFLFSLFITKVLVKVVKFTKGFHRILRKPTEWVKHASSLQIRGI